jgi:segregation and condensation protein B
MSEDTIEQVAPVGHEPPAVPKTVEEITGALEALLLIADEPMPETELAVALEAPTAVVAEALVELVAFYDETGRGFELRQVGGGWRYYTRDEHAELVRRHLLDGQQAKLSQAALETLAVVAYQQPISRARISAVRGVNVDGVMRTLLTRGLVAEAGHDAESGAMLFRTTGYFLERMGLRSLDELPALAPHLPEVAELEAELSQLARPEAVPDPPEENPMSSARPESPDPPPVDEERRASHAQLSRDAASTDE